MDRSHGRATGQERNRTLDTRSIAVDVISISLVRSLETGECDIAEPVVADNCATGRVSRAKTISGRNLRVERIFLRRPANRKIEYVGVPGEHGTRLAAKSISFDWLPCRVAGTYLNRDLRGSL